MEKKIDKLYFKINKLVFKNGKRFRSNRSSSSGKEKKRLQPCTMSYQWPLLPL